MDYFRGPRAAGTFSDMRANGKTGKPEKWENVQGNIINAEYSSPQKTTAYLDMM